VLDNVLNCLAATLLVATWNSLHTDRRRLETAQQPTISTAVGVTVPCPSLRLSHAYSWSFTQEHAQLGGASEPTISSLLVSVTCQSICQSVTQSIIM